MPRITRRWRTVRIGPHTVRVARDRDGVPHVRGAGPIERLAGLGYVHAVDRPMQLLLLRAAGRGRLCEVLVDDEASFGVDRFARSRGFAARAEQQAVAMGPRARALAEAYCAGLAAGLSRPWELAFLGMPRSACRFDPVDVIVAMELMSYVGLASLQEDLQRTLIDAIRRGVPVRKLAEWWYPHFECVDADLVERLRALNHWEGALRRASRDRLGQAAPAVARASNAWAVAGSRTVSGHPMIAFDPHLEASRLPSIFQEVVLEGDDGYVMGISVPGVPGVLMGRNRDLAFGFTYGFLDQSDFFVEEVRGGRCRRPDADMPCRVRNELVRRKHHKDVLLHVRENDLGVLEDGEQPRDGRFLCRAWAGARADWSSGFVALEELSRTTDVESAKALLRQVPISANWVLADRAGRVGWTMAGAAPKRPGGAAGIAPARGTDAGRVWEHGLLPASELPSGGPDVNGVVASANDPRPPSLTAGAVLVDAAMGIDRLDRIRTLVGERGRHDVESFLAIQRDVVSTQARRWRDQLRHAGLFAGRPVRPLAQLARWDGQELHDSAPAAWIEAFWREMMRTVFGAGLFGESAFELIASGTAVLNMYAAHFDDAALRHGPSWTGHADLDALTREVWQRTWREHEGRVPRRRASRIEFHHLLFGGRLPRWLGFDRGPFRIDGGRTSVQQVQQVPGRGGVAMIAPVYRFVCDLGDDGAWTASAGGPRDRRFSRFYASGLRDWLSGRAERRRPGLED